MKGADKDIIAIRYVNAFLPNDSVISSPNEATLNQVLKHIEK